MLRAFLCPITNKYTQAEIVFKEFPFYQYMGRKFIRVYIEILLLCLINLTFVHLYKLYYTQSGESCTRTITF